MLPLFDLMMKAQNGNAVEEMSRQFGLAQEQMTKAMAALMPAFSTGLKRSAANPYDFSALMSAAASGNYAQYFEDMSKAFTPKGVADGNDILAKIFGSKDISRAVAQQAAQMSGIGQDVYKQMLPIMANAMVGGFFKQIAEQFQAAGEAITAGRPADYFTQWMQAAGLQEKPKPAMSVFDNPFLQSYQAFFQQAATEAPKSAPHATNPFMQMFEAMLKTTASPATKPEAAPAPEPSKTESANVYAALISQMFDSGIEVQKSYQKNLDSIFDTYISSLNNAGKK